MNNNYDVIIVGTGAAGLFAGLCLPADLKVLMITKEKNFDKWLDLVSYIYSILDVVCELRDDLTIIYTAHSETERTEDGYMWTRMKTTGKKLNKLVQ